MTKGHGLQVNAWGSILSGEISQAISKIGNLQIETCSGLFNDFIESTNNILCLHVIGSTVDGRISYSKPVLGVKISFIELLSRIPDLKNEMEIIFESGAIYKITFEAERTFTFRLFGGKDLTYEITDENNEIELVKGSQWMNGFVKIEKVAG